MFDLVLGIGAGLVLVAFGVLLAMGLLVLANRLPF